MRNRAYRAIDVNDVKLSKVIQNREKQKVMVGVDVGKKQGFAVLRWENNDFERPWKIEFPQQIRRFVEVLQALQKTHSLQVAMEPTGTYGDPLRQALHNAALGVQRVSPKAAHDHAETFDGVPSKHDGKDAAIVAELAAWGKASVWPFSICEREQQLSYWVDRMDAQRRLLVVQFGRLEGLLARHWPEVSDVTALNSGALLQCLAAYGGPAAWAQSQADEEALQQAARWTRGKWSVAKAQRFWDSARHSVGVRQTEIDLQRMQDLARQALSGRREIAACRRELQQQSENQEVLSRQAAAVGASTACVLWTHLGDPRNYDSGASYRKAMGLNLKERSSGKYAGRLMITKRGHSQVRRWMYFAALRLTRQHDVRTWVAAKRERSRGVGQAGKLAVVAVMRKLALALYRVGVEDQPLDPSRLFPGSR